MATLHDRDRDVSDYRERERHYTDRDDREISLGTGTILGIFFALALLCAVFFGFGYSMGRKSTQAVLAGITPQNPTTTASMFTAFKPAAGNAGAPPVHAASIPAPEPEDKAEKSGDPDGDIVTTPIPSASDATGPVKAASQRVTTQKPTEAAYSQGTLPAVNANGTTMVQIAAVSHQEDANTLITALKKKGYSVFIRNEPQDRLLHVQVGPFATRKDADVMRQHLLADGYNAIVK